MLPLLVGDGRKPSLWIVMVTIHKVGVLDVTMVLETDSNAREVQGMLRILFILTILGSIPNDVLGCEILCIMEASVSTILLHTLKEALKLIETAGFTIRVTIIVNVDVSCDYSAIGELNLGTCCHISY